MKVINKLVAALALAVPLSPISLVTADELVVKDNVKASNQGTEDYSSYSQVRIRKIPVVYTPKTVEIIPMEYKDVIAVAPILDKSAVNINTVEDNDGQIKVDRLNLNGDVVFITD